MSTAHSTGLAAAYSGSVQSFSSMSTAHSTGLSVAYFGSSQGSVSKGPIKVESPVPVPSPPIRVVISSGHASSIPTKLPSSQVLVVSVPPVNVTSVVSSVSSSSPVTFAPTTVLAAFIASLVPFIPALTTSVGMPVLADITVPTTDSISLASTPPSAARITASRTALPVVIMPTLVPPPTVPTCPPKIGEVAPGRGPPVSPISNTAVTFPLTISARIPSGVSISGNLPIVAS